MKNYAGPDLGLPFNPSLGILRKLAHDKADVILKELDKQSFLLVLPSKHKLSTYLVHRMKEQGRFAALKVSHGRKDYFVKFPLGGKSAAAIAKREYSLYQFVNALKHEVIVPRKVDLIKTPFGYGLMTPFYEGIRLQHSKKIDKIEQIANLIYSLQTLLENRNFSADLVKNPILYNTMTHPIHSFGQYQKEVTDRSKLLPRDLSKKILTCVSKMRKSIEKFQDVPVFAHRDFFDKNIIVSSSLVLVDFEHSAIIKNYILGLNFDLANIVVQWYRYPQINMRLINFVRKKHKNKALFDFSLRACLIIQILAKIDPIAQQMHPGGIKENIDMLKKII